ncbi:FAD/NAD(P)-binding protein [Gracilaria domingensis]|nr:FAD/NAD(P)-binding protein [Gracilaria domingensis]
MKSSSSSYTPPPIVHTEDRSLIERSDNVMYDVIVAGGTLGILHAVALARRGWRVAVVERGPLVGRAQEWNTSRDEMNALVNEGVLSREQLERVIVTEVEQPGRIDFATRSHRGKPVRVPNVLNIGVAPDVLIRLARETFEQLGGVVYEFASVKSVVVGNDAALVTLCKQRPQGVKGALGAGGTGVPGTDSDEVVTLSSRLLIDAMGSFSPIAQQSRNGRKPDGICVVVGSCMSGPWSEKDSLDLIYSSQPINQRRSTQYFWEAFPVQREADTRTTYMFAYGPCDERRHSLTEALEDYLQELPRYQGIDVNDMKVKRVLFGSFPSYYKSSPAEVKWNRIIPVGDAAGLQSPISFGGFGCCLRHLTRITKALDDALQLQDDSLLSRNNLQNVLWYSPSLSVTGLFNRAMSVQPGQKTAGPLLDEYGINEVLWSNMKAMEFLGEKVQLPFLRDVVGARALLNTILVMSIRRPDLAFNVVFFLGLKELVGWSRHFFALLGYAAVFPILQLVQRASRKTNLLDVKQQFWLDRAVDGVKYGSGADYEQES